MKKYNLYIKLGSLKRMETCIKEKDDYVTDCGSIICVDGNSCMITCSGSKIKCELISIKEAK